MHENKLAVIDGATLMSTPLPPIRFVVNELLPQGLHILAGAPKVGKSWLALWLCLCIAKGEPVWDFPVEQGAVLYLCLEDSYSRIQTRLLDITDDAPEELFFVTMSEKLRCGLEQQIEAFLNEHPNTALIVIDTLQRIRSVTGDANAYANDYRDIGILKELADKYGIAILLIHHLRKMGDDDPMNMISGTTGISGATDTNFVLRKDMRGGSTATLYCTGRDIEYRELMLDFDSGTHIWNLLSDSVTALPPQDAIISLLSVFMEERKEFIGTPTELAELIDPDGSESISPKKVSKRILQSADALRDAGIAFDIRRSNGKRLVELHRADSADKSTAAVGAENIVPVDPDSAALLSRSTPELSVAGRALGGGATQ